RGGDSEPRARRIEHDEIRLLAELCQKLFGVFIFGNYCETGCLRVAAQIPGGCQIRVHADYFAKTPGERKGEESDARIEIERHIALCAGDYRFQQIRDEEAVHLETGEMADAVRKSAGLVNEVARPGQFKTIVLFIEQKQAFQFGNRFAEKPGQFGWRLGKV